MEDASVKGKRTQILIADDEDFIRKLSSRILSLEGFEILQAENGDRALELYNKYMNTISLVVLDIRMPGKSGIDVFQHLITMNPSVRVILCSGYGEYEFPQTSNDFYIQKPFSINDLLATVRKVLNLSKDEVTRNNDTIKNFAFLEE